MKTVFIVPTGIAAEIGGHNGDAMPAANLIASVSDLMISHPNVYNASDINEILPNVLYVEGSMLDGFLWREYGLKKVYSNRILVAVNSPVNDETVNAVSAARATLGVDASIVELETPLVMKALIKNGLADGNVTGVKELCSQFLEYDFDALAVATAIDFPPESSKKYFRDGGVNPWGAVEAIVSRAISNETGGPVAHAPLENPEMKMFNEVVDPRMAAEMVSFAYLHCVLKGLHKAPQRGTEITADQMDVLISPDNCCGPPHLAFAAMGKPVIVVRGNKTLANNRFEYDGIVYVENYLEAAGVVAAVGAGISRESIVRPLAWTKVVEAEEV